MAFFPAADFRLKSIKPHTANLLLTEEDATDAYLDLVIAEVGARVELDLDDDFDPPAADADETIDIDGNGLHILVPPRRVRSITTLHTRDTLGTLSAQASTTWRLSSSLNAAGTAMAEGRHLDELIALNISTGAWPDGTSTIRLVGKFGWAAVPGDIKRLVALGVYDLVKATADPLSIVQQRNTIDAQLIFGPSPEITDIQRRYRRLPVGV